MDSLSKRSKDDWNRRLELDYRLFMSDGVDSDRQMWDTGERDFLLLTSNVNMDGATNHTALEVGCGVGRLMRPASHIYKKVVGVDISEKAISIAKKLLGKGNTELHCTDGLSLSPLEDDFFDFAYSYATFGVIPAKVFAANLLELNRVLKPEATCVIQIYLGTEQETVLEDSLAIRSYERERFLAAVNLAGFQPLVTRELFHPLGDISNHEEGMVAHTSVLRKVARPNSSIEQIEKKLLSKPEVGADNKWPGSTLEYLLSINRAQDLINQGKLEEAKQIFLFAEDNYKDSDKSIPQIVDEINKNLET